MDRERLALENKQHLFCAPSCRDSHGSTRGVDHCELEMASFASFAEIKDSKEGMEDGTEQIARDTAVPNALGAISELRDRSVLYSDGLTHAGIHNHLWRPAGRRWLWISKASAIEVIGYPARRFEIVAKMASHAIFQYNVLATDDTHNTWTNMIVKMTILRLLGSSDDKEKIGVARPEGPLLRGSKGFED